MKLRTSNGNRFAFLQAVHHPAFKVMGVVAIALAVANCSSLKGNKYGVKASPRVIADGQPVPKGGGRLQVGNPYVVAGRTYVPQENPSYSAVGLASWYGADFHGRLTANGEVYDRHAVAAAHPTMPLPSYARVTNLANNHSIIVRVNDRGPFHGNRLMDVSQTAAEALDFRRAGTARVRVDYVGRASLNGSDDNILLATLRTDGQPAQLRKTQQPINVASPRTGGEGIMEVSNEMSSAGASASLSGKGASAASAVPVNGYAPIPPERPYASGPVGGRPQTAGL